MLISVHHSHILILSLVLCFSDHMNLMLFCFSTTYNTCTHVVCKSRCCIEFPDLCVRVDDLADRFNEGYYFSSLPSSHYVYLVQARVPVVNPQLIILRLEGCGHAHSAAAASAAAPAAVAAHLGGSHSGSKRTDSSSVCCR